MTISLWEPGMVPNAVGTADVDIPTLTIYQPDAAIQTGAAVLICPGGGYGWLAPHEGEPVALWLNSLGITGAVLKYRHAPAYGHPNPLLDAKRGLRMLRARADEWHLNPDHIGVLGFSAGGHLAGTLSTHFDEGNTQSTDPIERVSSRPSVSILIYPVILLEGTAAHIGSRNNLLGSTPSPDLVESLSLERAVTPQTPPTFLVHSTDDLAVPVQNSLRYALALEAAGVPFAAQIYNQGNHGYGLGNAGDPITSAWSAECAKWLKVFLEPHNEIV